MGPTRYSLLALVALVLSACAAEPEQIPVASIVASAEDGEHIAANTLDEDPATRWSAEGRAATGDDLWLVWRLDGAFELREARLSFYEGANANPTTFHLDVSADGRSWDRVLTATSSGDTTGPEAFPLDTDAVTHVRYVGEGRETTAWNSITEAGFTGVPMDAAHTDTSEPPPSPSTSSRPVTHGAELSERDVGVTTTADLVPSGPVVTTHDGQVIEGLDILVEGRDAFALVVRHDDVIVRDNRLRFVDGGQGIDIEPDAQRALIEHNELDAVRLSEVRSGTTDSNNNVGQRAVHVRGTQATVRRNHVALARSGIRVLGNGAQVVENYVSELARADDDSPDGASLHGTSISLPGDASDVVVARNRAIAGQSGGIILYARRGPLTDIDVTDNLVVGRGEGFGVYGGRTHTDEGHHQENRGIRIEGNRFQGTFGFPEVAGEGTNAAVDVARPDSSFEGNRWMNGEDGLPARCGITRDECED